MALTVDIVYEYTDDSGDTAEQVVNLPQGFTITQFREFAQSMAQIIDVIVHGLISNASLRFSYDMSGLTANLATVSSDVEDVGAFVFNTNEGRLVQLNIPALDESFVIAQDDSIDLSDPTVAAFVAAMTDGLAVTGGTIQPCDVAEDDIVSVESSRERFRSTARRR